MNEAILKKLCELLEQQAAGAVCAQLADGTRLTGTLSVNDGEKMIVWCPEFGTTPLDPQPDTADLLPCADVEAPVQCFEQPETTQTINGDETAPWNIIPGVFELVRNPGGGGNPGFSNNAPGGLEYSLTGTNFGAFGNTVFGDDLQAPGAVPLFILNTLTGDIVEVAITSWAGGGNNAYTGTVDVTTPAESFTCRTVNGVQTCWNALGEETPFDAAWTLVECKDLCDVVDAINDKPVGIVGKERCWERPVSLVFTDNVVDTNPSIPITEPITIIPDETGQVDAITIRVNNPQPFVGTNYEGLPLAIEIGGAIYEYDPALSPGLTGSQNAPNGNSSLPGNATVDRAKYWFPVDIQATAGVPIVINYTDQGAGAGTGSGDPAQLVWSAAGDSDNGQVQESTLQAGQHAQVALYTDDTERWSECDFTDDTTVRYGPTGEITTDPIPGDAERVRCDKCCDAPEPEPQKYPIGNHYRLTGLTGELRNREWHNTVPLVPAPDRTTANAAAIREAHDLTATPDTETVVTSLTLNDTDDTAGEMDVQIVDGWLNNTTGAPILARYDTPSEGYVAVLIGDCCTEPQLVTELAGTAYTTDTFEIPVGLSRVELWNLDLGGANSSPNFQTQNNAGTWVNTDIPPGVFVAADKPTEECIPIIYCPETESHTRATDGTIIDITQWSACPVLEPCTTAAAAGSVDVANTHLIEGCILSDPADPDSDKLSAFTIVDDDGNALFSPRPLTDLGFEADCC